MTSTYVIFTLILCATVFFLVFLVTLKFSKLEVSASTAAEDMFMLLSGSTSWLACGTTNSMADQKISDLS